MFDACRLHGLSARSPEMQTPPVHGANFDESDSGARTATTRWTAFLTLMRSDQKRHFILEGGRGGLVWRTEEKRAHQVGTRGREKRERKISTRERTLIDSDAEMSRAVSNRIQIANDLHLSGDKSDLQQPLVIHES